MFKNFSAPLLGISGRQSELIELALTYAFRGIDVDMSDMVKRSLRTDFEDASKYLRAADIQVGGFSASVDLDADNDTFKTQLTALHAIAETAEKLGAKRAFINVPPATDRMSYPEFFEQTQSRLNEIGKVLEPRGIKVGVSFNAATDAADGKQYEFVRNVEGFIALVKGVASPAVGYVIDSWHWHVGGGNMEMLKQVDPSRIVIVRLADLAADAVAESAKLSDRVIPTTESRIDQIGIVKFLADAGFSGPVLPTSSVAKAKGQTRESIVNAAQEGIDAIFRAAGQVVDPRPMDLIQTLYADLGRDEDEERVIRVRVDDDIDEPEDDSEEIGSGRGSGRRDR